MEGDEAKLWGWLRVRAGVTLPEFDTLDISEVNAIVEAIHDEDRRQAEIRAQLYCLIVNSGFGAKKTYTPEDFLPPDDDEQERKLAARAAMISKGERESRESSDEDDEDDEVTI